MRLQSVSVTELFRGDFLINIAIDGPSGAGKSTIAKAVAQALGYIYIDTGAMYRSVGLYFRRKGVDIKNDSEAVKEGLNDITVNIKYIDGVQHIFLNGEDVSDKIRTPEISMAASDAGTVKEIREKMTVLQRKLAASNNCVMDGRDIGSYVLPSADIKIYLTADVSVRAERRLAELKERGHDVTFEEVLEDMKKRDENDSTRKFMPLKKADDAVLVDTSLLTLENSVNSVLDLIKDGLKNE